MSHDILSDVLRGVRLRGAVFYYMSYGGQWAAEAPPAPEIAAAVMPGVDHVMEFHVVTKGAGWAAIVGQSPVRLEAGDIAEAVREVARELAPGGGPAVTSAIGNHVDAIVLTLPTVVPPITQGLLRGIGLLIDLAIDAVFVMFGLFAAREKKWAFITGMVLYALDGILMVVFKDFLGFGFHLFFLWLLFIGLRALNQLNKSYPRAVTGLDNTGG